jgi:hypothetical protein
MVFPTRQMRIRYTVMWEYQAECDKKVKVAQSRLDRTPEDEKLGSLLGDIADLVYTYY